MNHMLAIQTQPKYIQKTVQLPNGSWALVVFELIEINGKITAKAVCGKLLDEKSTDAKSFGGAKEEVLALPIYKSPEEFVPFQYSKFDIQYSLPRDLSFIVSQPSRAPNLI